MITRSIWQWFPTGRAPGYVVVAALVSTFMAMEATSYPGGITGYTRQDGGAGCGGCHSVAMAQTLTVAISGASTLAAGQTGFYTIDVSNGPASTVIGFNAAVNNATVAIDALVASGTNTQKVGIELTHTLAKNSTNSSGVGSYAFSFIMPVGAANGTAHTLFATARSGGEWNHDLNDHAVSTATPFTALLGGSAMPTAFVFGQTGTLSTSGGEVSGGVTYSTSNSLICSISGTTLTAAGVGSCTITANKPLTTTSSALSDSFTLTVNQAPQALLTAQIGGSGTPLASTVFFSGALSISGGSGGGAPSYASLTNTICTVAGTVVSYVASGTCTVRATKAADTNFLSTFDDVSITINPATQTTLTALIGGVAAPSASTVFLSGALSISGGSGVGALSYVSQTTGVCTVMATTVSYIAGGTCIVRATRGADSQYLSTFDDVTITINLATQAALTALIDGFAAPAASIAGLTGALTSTGGSGIGGVSYASLTNGVCMVAATTVSYVAIGTCTVRATKAADTQYASTFDDVSLTINQGSQTITFAPLPNKVTTDAPFVVAATGGNSGNPVTFTASGVCSQGGVNGSTITLSGMAGSCMVTANQMGNANYTAATPVAQNFMVADLAAEVFPPNCVIPPGWIQQPGAESSWIVATDSPSAGTCSFKSAPVASSGTPLQAGLQLNANFNTGNILLKARVSTETGWDCFQVLIDGVAQDISALGGVGCVNVALTGASGIAGYPAMPIAIPIAAGNHTVTLRYDKDDLCCIGGLDAVWVDELFMPLSAQMITSPLLATGIYNAGFSYTVTVANFPVTVSATGLPPGLSYNAMTRQITGTPSAAGTFSVSLTASNPGGVNPGAVDMKSLTIIIDKAAQTINFPPINNRLNSAPAFTVSAAGGPSGQPVTFTASGVCTSSGADGSTITTDLTLGTCTVTATQAGDANYYPTIAMQSFSVVGSAFENFPPACNMPAGWTNTLGPGWVVSVNEESATGACSLRTAPPVTFSGSRYQSEISFTGSFAAGTISFKYRISTEPNYKCFQFFINGTPQNLAGSCTVFGLTGISGESGWVSVNFPISAGVHTLSWRYDKDSDCCTFGTRDAVWIDDVVLPLFTLSVAKNGTGTGTVTSMPTGINCGATCSAVMSGNVQLFPTPAFLSYFAGWSGSCSGNGACVVSMTASRAVTATFSPATAPGAPQGVMTAPGNGQVTMTFSPPASDGGSPITAYGVNCTAMGDMRLNSGPGSPIVVPGMTNGLAYTCVVGASNFVGSSFAPGVVVTPRTVPDAPTGLIANPGNGTASISFTPPAFNGGAPITLYTATCASIGQITRFGSSGGMSPISVPLLVNGATYDCTIVATNAAGAGAASASVAVTPRTLPDAPTGLMATVGNAQASISFTPPSFNGGAPISLYTATCSAIGQITRAGTTMASPVQVNLLVNGVAYSCSIVATNAAGDSVASMAIALTPRTVPDAPTGLMAAPGNTTASISFAAPVFNGGSSISLYTSTCTAMGQTTRVDSSGMSPVVATQLTNGVQYSCAVTATNVAGTSVPSTAVLVTARTVPDAPTGVMAAPGNASALISFTASATNGGAPISLYVATCTSVGQTTRTASAAVSPITVSSLVNGVTYDCSVVAQNAAGDSAASDVVAVTPRTLPGAPENLSVQARDGRANFSFTPPAADGGSAVSSYTLSCNPGAVSASGAATSITLTGLVNATNYSCTVAASNSAGAGPTASFAVFAPAVQTGNTYWTQICTDCHATLTPIVPQLNAAGTTRSVLQYAIPNQASMAATPQVTELTNAELTEIANYLASVIPPTTVSTPFNTPAVINLGSQISVGSVSFESLEVDTPPTKGMLSAFTGTTITYTPNPGTVGMDSFTFRGKRAMPSVLLGDSRTVSITVSPPPAPMITSLLTASGANGAVFSYTISGTNSPTGYDATGLPNGLMVNMSNGQITGTPTVGGTFMVTISAMNAGGTGTAQLVITLNAAAQSINFPAQIPASQPFAPGGTFPIAPLATATSGLTVTYASASAGVCSVSGTTVTMLSAGPCTISASQGGNLNFLAAPVANGAVTITPTLPGAPVIGVATPGNLQATIAFSAPANTGGVAISSYTASCNAIGQTTRIGTGMVSPITVGSLVNGVTYSCSVTATNSVGTSLSASATVAVTPAPTPTPPIITSVNNASFTVNAPGSFNVTATGTPSVFTYAITLGTLPMGVSLNPATGNFSGTPTQAGMFAVTLSVSNGFMGPATQMFTLNVARAVQTISFTGPGNQPLNAGSVAVGAFATSGLTVAFSSTSMSVCTMSGTTVNLVGIGMCNITASQAGNANYLAAPDVLQSFTVGTGTQAIAFAAQSINTRTFAANGMFAVSPLATASSGLTPSYTSLTQSVCTISMTTVTMVRAGLCTIAANQVGDGNYAPATPVSQSITITGIAPGAPTLNTATGGDTKITLAFSPPASDGGVSITGYTANCGGNTASGSASPITVIGLMNGASYSCTVTASNGLGMPPASTPMMATPNPLPGAAVWAATCGLGGCHGSPPNPSPGNPVGTRLNAGGTTTTVVDFAIATQSLMKQLPSLTGMSMSDRAAVAAYIQDFIPAVNSTTPFNTPVAIDVSSQITLNTFVVAFTSLEIVTPPVNGMITSIVGSTINYTPNNGFTGTDTFTYRGKQAGAGIAGDPRSVSVTVSSAQPVITSPLTANGIIGQAFSYQIAATNIPTSYNATPLPNGLTVNMSNGQITGMPSASGSTMVTISATNAGGTGTATLVINVNLIPQTITFGAQPSPINFVSGGVVMIAPTASGGGSMNAIVYSSLTPSVCSGGAGTFTILSAGVCTIAADQAGNATYAAAPQVTRSITINGAAPGAPIIGAVTGGNTQATINFTPPANTGGLAITSYTANCGGITNGGSVPPIVVSGLVNGITYACTVQATNAAGTGPVSGTVMVTPAAIMFTGTVYSRKTHGNGVGDKNLWIDVAPAINGAITVEPRAIGSGHRIVFVFTNPPTNVTSLSVQDANMMPVGSASPSYNGNELIVTLTGVPDNQRVTVTATGVNGAVNASVALGFLIGDTNGNGHVNASDVSAVKARVSQPVNTGNNYLFDVNASGTITNADVSAVKARSGLVIP